MPDKKPRRSFIPALVVGIVVILAVILVLQMVRAQGWEWLSWAGGTGTVVLLVAEALLVVGVVWAIARRRR